MLKRIILAVTLIAAVGLSFAPFHHASSRVTASILCPGNATCTVTYYSDAAHTHQIGYYTIFCNGAISYYGTQQGYSVWTDKGCNGGSPV